MNDYPQAYHITWGTYGARLTGSEKPHVTRQQNQFGTPLPGPNADAETGVRESMAQDKVSLTLDQRKAVEAAIIDVTHRYDWAIHAIAIQSDHCHVVITALCEGQALRDALKAVASKALNQQFDPRTWWAVKGSCKYCWDREYFENATKYVRDQRDF